MFLIYWETFTGLVWLFYSHIMNKEATILKDRTLEHNQDKITLTHIQENTGLVTDIWQLFKSFHP